MNRLNKMIQNYRVLTNNKYRLVTNIVIPVVLGIITAVLAEGLMIQFAMFPPIFMILAYFNFWPWVKWVFPPAAAVLLIVAIIATYYHMITKVRNSYKDI